MLYRRQLIAYTEPHRPAKLPTDTWWVIAYAISPAIDQINTCFVISQNRSLLMAQHEQLIDNLVASLCVMFNINLVHDVNARDNPDSNDDAVIHTLDRWQINAESIVAWVEDQGSFPRQCYERLSTIEREDVVRQIAKYAMGVVAGLSGVKAQRDGRNGPSDLEVPPVLPHQLAKLHHGFFIRDVFEPYRSHLSLHWRERRMRRSAAPTAAHDAEFLPPPSLPPSSSAAFASAGQRFLQPCASSSLASAARKSALGPNS
ncbi:unnamed protein product [Sphagnum balticum]